MKKVLLVLAMTAGIFANANNNVTSVSTIESAGVTIENVSITATQDSYFINFNKGKMDGQRFVQNKTGNIAIGFLGGLIGVGVVALASNQSPSYAAASGHNKDLIDTMAYREGYKKGAAGKATGHAAIGLAGWVVLLLLL